MPLQSTSATFMLARLCKLPRLMRTARILKNFHHLANKTVFQIGYMLFCSFTLAHWAACGFYFLARWEVFPASCLVSIPHRCPSFFCIKNIVQTLFTVFQRRQLQHTMDAEC
jgi:hypothetical protein